MTPPIRFRHRVEYAAVSGLAAVVRVLPDAAVRGLGATMGLLFHAADGVHRRVAIRQLQAAFPVRSASECRAIARATFMHFGRSFLMMLKFRAFDREAIRSRIEFEGLDHLRDAEALGKGVLLFSGHIGYWELLPIAHPLVLSPQMSVVARQLDNPLLNPVLEGIRCITGNKVIYKHGAVRRILRNLESGEAVGMLIDQYATSADAVPVEFFGRKAATTSAIAAIALRTGAPLIPFFALPLPGGRYRLILDHPVALPAAGSPDPVRDLTQRCTDVLEMYVRRYPHLWLWMHRRWRESANEGAGEPEMFPADAPDAPEEAGT